MLAYLDRAARAGGLEPFGGVGEPWERAATADGTGTPSCTGCCSLTSTGVAFYPSSVTMP